jgi:hypothetical protein
MDTKTEPKPWPVLHKAPKTPTGRGPLESSNGRMRPWDRRVFPPGFGPGWTRDHVYTGATLMELHDDPEAFR